MYDWNKSIKLNRNIEAQENLEEALEFFKKIHSSSGEAEALLALSELYGNLGSSDLALESCGRAIAIAENLKIPLLHECQAMRESLL